MTSAESRHPLRARADDLYETPACAVEALQRVEQLPHFLWEPAAGRGAIVDILRAAGHEVLASDLVDYGIPTHFARRDFLLETKAPNKCGGIICNPPYKLATEFVEHALNLGVPLVVMLLRLAFLESRRRAPLLDGGQLARIHVFAARLPRMHRDGWIGPRVSSSVAYAWFVWDANHAGSITIDRI